MKLALLLPGYIESPDYRHLVVIDHKLQELGYTTVRVDACNLWKTGDVNNYTTTGYMRQVKKIIDSYLPQKPTEIVLVGHSLGSLIALQVGNSFQENIKIICLSPPFSLNDSDHKWIDGFRTSQKDLPVSPSEFRKFIIPFSFTEDRKQYSVVNSIKHNQKPLQIIMGESDPSVADFQILADKLSLPNLAKIDGMAHDFRQSDALCNQVANEMERFLKND